jgi:hypothetical protein
VNRDRDSIIICHGRPFRGSSHPLIHGPILIHSSTDPARSTLRSPTHGTDFARPCRPRSRGGLRLHRSPAPPPAVAACPPSGLAPLVVAALHLPTAATAEVRATNELHTGDLLCHTPIKGQYRVHTSYVRPGIVAHISRQINNSIITVFLHHDITTHSS